MSAEAELHRFWIDLHLHTVLSPCADPEMGAPEIVARCRDGGIDLIAVTDHNHTGNFAALRDAAQHGSPDPDSVALPGPVVLPGMEVQSMEDIHVVVIFEDEAGARTFQDWLWRRMPPIRNREDVFGFQLVIDQDNNVLDQEPILLVQGAQYPLDEIAARGMEAGAIVIPAHLDRPSFSCEAVLGQLPENFPCSAVEISPRASHAELEGWKKRYPGRTLVRSSDAHRLEEISRSRCTPMLLAELSFEEVKLALSGTRGRRVLLP
ncbi:MAG: PHP domain-containing protein [Synergistaceae bacterium]|jgi:PHP family Zn ribbon phosphoesterase|nr:PHP domain-containing protein [Synergistaceae bacterium]